MTAPAAAISRLSALLPVADQLQASTAQLHAMAMARAHGLDATAVERLGSVVTEMAANIARHAGRGQIILRAVGDWSTGCIEVLALDKGPGITNMARAMRDEGAALDEARADAGFAGIRRLADLFDIYSQPGHGTAVVAHVGTPAGQGSTCPCTGVMHERFGVVCVPVHGETECGDDWAVDVAAGRVSAMVVDGLGHGPGAAVAALAAVSAYREIAMKSPEAVLESMNAALHSSRGAALSVTVIDHEAHAARFCGVGNVDGRIVSAASSRHLVPQNGIVGHTMPRPQAADVPWPAAGRLVMHSDGISSRWQAEHYPGLLARHPALLAGVLFRDFARARDDATVLVVGDLPAPPA